MTAVRTSLNRAAEYRRLAEAANALVDSSQLANVREKHEVAAARWTDLADLAERASAEHASRVAAAPAPASAPALGPPAPLDLPAVA
jgi:hypothetical protein